MIMFITGYTKGRKIIEKDNDYYEINLSRLTENSFPEQNCITTGSSYYAKGYKMAWIFVSKSTTDKVNIIMNLIDDEL